MKCVLLFHVGLLFCAIEFANAQPLTIQWSKCLGGSLGDVGHSIRQTLDDGFLICGLAVSNDGDVAGNHNASAGDGWVVKLDSNGSIVWQRCYGGSNGEEFESIVLNDNGGFTVIGGAGSFDGDVIGVYDNGDYWVVNCNDTGAIQWQKILGGTQDEVAHQIIRTYDNGYMTIGRSASSDFDVFGRHDTCSPQAWDTWLAKLDSVGNIEWAKCYGGCHNEEGYSIAQTPDSGYVFVSRATSDNGDVQGLHGAVNEQGYEDYWVVKINDSGAIQWQKCLGGSLREMPSDIKLTNDGGYITKGYATSHDFDVTGNHGIEDDWVVKMDSTGNIQWQKCFGGSGTDYGWKILPLSDGGYLSLNSTESTDGDLAFNPPAWVDAWLLRLDSSGNILWQQCLGGLCGDELYDVDLTTDGGCVLTGITCSDDGYVTGNHGNWDEWVIKLGPLPDGVTGEKSAITDFTSYLNNAGKLTINYFANGNEHVQLQLFDVTGRIIFTSQLTVSNGFNRNTFQAVPVNPGIYLVRINTQSGIVTRKVIVQ